MKIMAVVYGPDYHSPDEFWKFRGGITMMRIDAGGGAATYPSYQPVSVQSRSTLSYGSTGSQVKQLQQLLGIHADGIFGSETRAAVMDFQRKHHLAVDGVVGPQTWAALLGSGENRARSAQPKVDTVEISPEARRMYEMLKRANLDEPAPSSSHHTTHVSGNSANKSHGSTLQKVKDVAESLLGIDDMKKGIDKMEHGSWKEKIEGFGQFAFAVISDLPGGWELKGIKAVEEVGKLAKATKEIKNVEQDTGAIEHAHAATKSTQATLRGASNPVVREALNYGKQMHKDYDFGPNVEKEVRLPSGKRMDGYDRQNKIVYELKPDNPQAIKKGTKQLENYVREANQVYGPGHKGVLKTYPTKD
jgi:hypothetical protein